MEKLNPMITIDYSQYQDLLEQLKDIQDLLRRIYDETKDNTIKEEIEAYMIDNHYWI